jgi:hypothetical protein
MDSNATCPVCGDTVEWCRKSLEEARKRASEHYIWAMTQIGPDGRFPWERELLEQEGAPA